MTTTRITLAEHEIVAADAMVRLEASPGGVMIVQSGQRYPLGLHPLARAVLRMSARAVRSDGSAGWVVTGHQREWWPTMQAWTRAGHPIAATAQPGDEAALAIALDLGLAQLDEEHREAAARAWLARSE